MTSGIFVKQAKALLETAGFGRTFELTPITGGGNNRVFLTRQNDQVIGILKQYYHAKGNLRDRLSSEYNFSKFLWDHNIHQIPMPIACDPLNHLAFFSYIDGRKISPAEITKNHINQAIDFFHSINFFRLSDDAKLLPDAQEACYSLADHINLTEKRILNLKKIQDRSLTDKKALQFIHHELLPAWEIIRKKTCATAQENDIKQEEQIPAINKRISPSDFGFHNALMDKKGALFFMDFEYAGWDDPAKTICDFFCQPAVPVPELFFSDMIESVVSDMNEPDTQRQRIEILLPVYQIKWCCIVLNEFLPRGKARRAFIEKFSDSESIKDEQLQKAKSIVQKIFRDSD